MTTAYHFRKPHHHADSLFFHGLADTEPDAWGRRVIARAHAKERRENATLGALSELDYLCGVDDFSRVGALRVRDENGNFLRAPGEHFQNIPPLVDLKQIYAASRAVESREESLEDLRYLQGKGTSLGGMRPKCTVMDDDGTLAIGKFPSVGDMRSITRGEVLALHLASLAGIQAATSRIFEIENVPVAVIRRFDRAPEGRIHYLSASSLLQAERGEDRTYVELVDAMMSVCRDAREDTRQLWRRLVFNFLINNVDDHLQNTGFLYAGKGLWQLSPAFDINPFPDKNRESKTWLDEDCGPVTSVKILLEKASFFHLSPNEARDILTEVKTTVAGWRKVATTHEIGLTAKDIADFEPAVEDFE